MSIPQPFSTYLLDAAVEAAYEALERDQELYLSDITGTWLVWNVTNDEARDELDALTDEQQETLAQAVIIECREIGEAAQEARYLAGMALNPL